MTKKDKEKALEILLGFKKRAEKLSKKAEDWEVNSNLNKIMKKMGIPLEFSGGGKLSKKGKVKLVQSVQSNLLTHQLVQNQIFQIESFANDHI